jgi:CRISPR-associated protein Cmr2
MRYDLYVDPPENMDVFTQIRLLVSHDSPLPIYLGLVHDKTSKATTKSLDTPFNHYLAGVKKLVDSLGIQLSLPDMNALPPGSWFFQCTFTLARPWISKDDDLFYVAESVNPVRKDKVFKIPIMAASSWKGLLRWTAMYTCLELQKGKLSDSRFAKERFVQTLLFGDEKGEEPDKTKDWTAHLDSLKPGARAEYENLLRNYFGLKPDDPLPHHRGRLNFYPSFFYAVDIEVINPHSRQSKAGTHPIYLECVPINASSTFSLLYVPFDLIGEDESAIKKEAKHHLRYLITIIKDMFLTYGFSAKRTSGYGTAKDEITDLVIATRAQGFSKNQTTFSQLKQEVENVRF